MALETTFTPLNLEDLLTQAALRKEQGWRFVQILAVNTEAGIDLIYSFMKDNHLDNLRVNSVKKGVSVPSISKIFLAAFVFENEVHDLFGVDIKDIVIDFEGNFYALARKEPMTIISPEQKAARDKARKIVAAKSAREQKNKASTSSGQDASNPLAGLDPEKTAKVKAALNAKIQREAAQAAKGSPTSIKKKGE